MSTAPNKFLELIQNPVKFTFFLLTRLPAAFFSGVRLKYADEKQSVVTIPYKWFSKNPFKIILILSKETINHLIILK